MKNLLSLFFLVLLIGSSLAGSSQNSNNKVSIKISSGSGSGGSCGKWGCGHKNNEEAAEEENVEAPVDDGSGAEQPAGDEEDNTEVPSGEESTETPTGSCGAKGCHSGSGKVSVVIKKNVSIKVGSGCKSGNCGGHKDNEEAPAEEENVEAPVDDGSGAEQPAGDEEDNTEVPAGDDKGSCGVKGCGGHGKVSVVIKKHVVIGGCKSGNCGGHKNNEEAAEEENVEAPTDGGSGAEQPAGEEESNVEVPAGGEENTETPAGGHKCGLKGCGGKAKVNVVIKKNVSVKVGAGCKGGNCGNGNGGDTEENVEAPTDGGSGAEQPAGEEEDSTATPAPQKSGCTWCH